MTTKVFQVTDLFGKVHIIRCDFIFNNDGELVFRAGERGSSEVNASFAAGQWSSCIRDTALKPATEKAA